MSVSLRASRCSPSTRILLTANPRAGRENRVASRRVTSRRIARRVGRHWRRASRRSIRYKDRQSRGAEGYSLAYRRTRVQSVASRCSTRSIPRDSPTVYYARRDIAGPRASLLGIPFNRDRADELEGARYMKPEAAVTHRGRPFS